ncbi:MAG: hypothetical protein V3V28_01810 [Polaribacter sp.]|uniref:hypothetical protein n=1 Tax=Polaribacter sp. TaxID=1920175 RepID=UPI002F355342
MKQRYVLINYNKFLRNEVCNGFIGVFFLMSIDVQSQNNFEFGLSSSLIKFSDKMRLL